MQNAVSGWPRHGLGAFMIAGCALAASPAVAQTSPAFPGTFSATPLTVADLQGQVARENLAMTATAQQQSSVSGNSVNGTTQTGEVAIGGQAFQNASGMLLVTSNSGNNVSMNSALSVNVVINSSN